MARRRLLVVAYFFPPVGGVGVQRTLKWIVNLAHLGWDSVVITPRKAAYPLRDPRLVAEIPPSAVVVRTSAPEPVGLPAHLLGRSATATPATGAAPAVPAAVTPSRPSLGRRAARALVGAWTRAWRAVLFPDDARLWVPFAARAAVAAHRARPVDAILSSSPPVSGHLVAMEVAGRTGRPWVADFRDPWVGNAFAAPASPGRADREAATERRIVEAADRVVVASPSMAADLASRYPDRAERIVCIPNGYDRAEVAAVAPWPRDRTRFVLVYAGSVYGDHELELFLDGLERLAARRPEVRERLGVEFVGRLNEASLRLAAERAAPERLGSLVTYLGFRPRAEALGRMASADALLHVVGGEPGKDRVIGAKLLEYLAFDLPILAVVPKGDARTVLEELHWGVIADPEPDAIADALERLMDAPAPSRQADPEGRYDRTRLAERLEALLDEVVAERRAP